MEIDHIARFNMVVIRSLSFNVLAKRYPVRPVLASVLLAVHVRQTLLLVPHEILISSGGIPGQRHS